MHFRADGDQQEIDSRLHGSPHTDNAELIVQLYQKVTDGCINQEADNPVCPPGSRKSRAGCQAEGLPSSTVEAMEPGNKK